MKKDPLLIGIVLMLLLAIGGFIIFQIITRPSTPVTETVGNPPIPRRISPPQDLLAGHDSPFFIFKKSTYDNALQANRIIFLDFYANWCPICRAEAPELIAGFNELQTSKVVGFRVNYNDSETDEDEKALAQQFGITYQHTKVVLIDGKVVLKDGGSWDKETFLKEINKFL